MSTHVRSSIYHIRENVDSDKPVHSGSLARAFNEFLLAYTNDEVDKGAVSSSFILFA